MPTSKYFDQCPPFPSDVPVVDLRKVSLQELQENNTEEAEHLYHACREWGFFLLDVKGSKEGEILLQDAETMFNLTAETFALDQSILDKYAFNPPHDLIGYDERKGLKR